MTTNKKDMNLNKNPDNDPWKEFKITSKIRNKRDKEYILIGRGWEDKKHHN